MAGEDASMGMLADLDDLAPNPHLELCMFPTPPSPPPRPYRFNSMLARPPSSLIFFFHPASDDEDEWIVGDDDPTDEHVACVCGEDRPNYTGLWVRCSNELCEAWQHAACYGFKRRSQIPNDFRCSRCATDNDKHATPLKVECFSFCCALTGH